MPEENVLPWSGEGLPPVGLLVEWSEWQNGKFEKATVLAYADGDAWIKPEWRPSMIVGNPAGFRPFQSPDQIATDERLAAIKEMASAAHRQGQITVTKLEMAERLYDAGYRKQVNP